MTEQPDNYIDEMQEIVDFLCGEKPLQGRWYGEKHTGIPTFWWRNNLRIAVRQLDQYYADFYRNKLLEAKLRKDIKYLTLKARYERVFLGGEEKELTTKRRKKQLIKRLKHITAQFNSGGSDEQ